MPVHAVGATVAAFGQKRVRDEFCAVTNLARPTGREGRGGAGGGLLDAFRAKLHRVSIFLVSSLK